MNLPPHVADRNGELWVEEVSLRSIAERFGTPTFVYSKAALVEAYQRFAGPLASVAGRRASLVCYAVKANPNIAVLDTFAYAGAGFDIVSGGELERVLHVGGAPDRILFSGVGKTREEMSRALDVGIRCFNVESTSEIAQLAEIAQRVGKPAPVSIRINPDVDARTHPYISTGLKENKFGIAYDRALEAYREVARRAPHLSIVGVDCHIGSQLLDEAPLLEALDKLLVLVERLDEDGIEIRHLDLGGGIGIAYEPGDARRGFAIDSYLRHVLERVDAWETRRSRSRPIELLFEPGRSLVGAAGLLLTRTLVLKRGEEKDFAVVDAAMNDLIRPSLYDAWHAVVPVVDDPQGSEATWDVVGPICESGDWLAKDRRFKAREGALIAFLAAGAYAMSMASNYNSRPRAAEVLVDGSSAHLVRKRETIAELFAGERLPAP